MNKQQANVKDYTDKLVAAIEDVGEDEYQYVCGRGLCWCDRVNGYGSRHSNSCRRLRKLVKAAKGRYRRRSHEKAIR